MKEKIMENVLVSHNANNLEKEKTQNFLNENLLLKDLFCLS